MRSHINIYSLGPYKFHSSKMAMFKQYLNGLFVDFARKITRSIRTHSQTNTNTILRLLIGQSETFKWPICKVFIDKLTCNRTRHHFFLNKSTAYRICHTTTKMTMHCPDQPLTTNEKRKKSKWQSLHFGPGLISLRFDSYNCALDTLIYYAATIFLVIGFLFKINKRRRNRFKQLLWI